MDIRIEGIEQVIQNLKNMPELAVKNAFGKALTASAVPIVENLKTNTPVDTGKLQRHAMSIVEIDRDGKGGKLSVGFGKKYGKLARLIEYGHRIIGHKPNKVDKGKTVPSKPFMRQTFAQSQNAATEAFTNRMLKSFSEGINKA
jgi:HK97 gp10 family phage protein